MQYNGETNGQDLVTLCDDFAKSDSISYPIEKKTRMANLGTRIIRSWIYEIYGGWIDTDKNETTLPEPTRSIVADQRQYTIPDEAGQLQGVEYMDESGNWHALMPITLEQIKEQSAETEFMKTSGVPLFYRPIANGFKIYPAADFSQAASLKIQTNTGIVPFTITSTTATPGFDSQFHEAVAVYMALQYAEINSLDNVVSLRKKWSNEDDANYPPGFEQRIKKHYQTKFKEMFPPKIRQNSHDPVMDVI